MEPLEETHVRHVYERIAGHFSATRYKAWPVVDRFFQTLPPGSCGLDAGCGNGKNMGLRPDVRCIGLDLYGPASWPCRDAVGAGACCRWSAPRA